jgi:uncharacterized protein (TIGR02172 family)
MSLGLDIVTKINNDVFNIKLLGSLDSNTVSIFDSEVETIKSNVIVIDMEECSYISSAGLRSLLILYKNIIKMNGSMSVTNVSSRVRDIFELTGFSKILDVKKNYREISIDGCEFISAGVCGECYRLDSDTIVKLYGEGIDLKIAEKEKDLAKAAFVLGVPTAISYDVVSCKNRFGVVYEMIEAQLFSSLIREDLDNISKHALTLSSITKSIHAIKGDPNIFPNLKESFRDYIKQMDFCLNSDDISLLLNKLEQLPDSEHCVHFDLHTSNIMIKNNEPIIIDMGDFSIGSYLFDIGLIYMIYGIPELKISELVTKIPASNGHELWKYFVKDYFSDKTQEEYELFDRNRYFLGSLRAIYTITFLPKFRDELAANLKDFLLPRIKSSA